MTSAEGTGWKRPDDAELAFLLDALRKEGPDSWAGEQVARHLRYLMQQRDEHLAEADEIIERILRHEEALTLAKIAGSLARLAEALAPVQPDVVGTPYVAERLNVTVVWAAKMAERGIIPKSCVIPGTGHGKPWKFDRRAIDRWIAQR